MAVIAIVTILNIILVFFVRDILIKQEHRLLLAAWF